MRLTIKSELPMYFNSVDNLIGFVPFGFDGQRNARMALIDRHEIESTI